MLVLLKEFKSHLPEKVVIYLNGQKVMSINAAAVLADEYTLMHKSVFSIFFFLIQQKPIPF